MRYPSVIRVIRVLYVRYSCIIAFIVRTPPSVQYPLLPSIFLRVRIDSLASLTFWSLYSPHACVVSDRCSLFALLHLSRIVSPNFVSLLSVIVRSRCRPPVIAIESFGRGLSEIRIGIDLVVCRGRPRSIDLRATRSDHYPSPVASFTPVFPLVVCLCGSSYQPTEFTEILIVAIGFCQPPLPPNSLVYNHARLGLTLLSPSRPPSPSTSRSNGPALRAHHFLVEQVQRALYILSDRHH